MLDWGCSEWESQWGDWQSVGWELASLISAGKRRPASGPLQICVSTLVRMDFAQRELVWMVVACKTRERRAKKRHSKHGSWLEATLLELVSRERLPMLVRPTKTSVVLV